MVRRLFSPLGIVLLIAGIAGAQEADSTRASVPELLEEEIYGGASALEPNRVISVQYANKTLGEVCEDLSRKLGINFVTARGLDEETINLSLTGVRWRKVVEFLAAKYDLEMEQLDDNVIVFTRPPQVSMEFSDADIRIVLDLLARQVSKNIVLHEQVQGTITLNLQKVPWDKALEVITKTAGYAVVPETADKSLIRVIPRNLLQAEIELKHIQLNYLRPPSTYRAVMPSSVSGGSGDESALESGFFVGEIQPSTGNAEEDFTLLQALKGILERQPIEGESIFYDAYSNALIVNVTTPKLLQIQEVIRALDKRPDQVFVDVTFVSTSNSDFMEQGLRFDDAPGDGVERGIVSRLVMANTGAAGALAQGDEVFDSGNTVQDARSAFLGQFPFSFGNRVDDFSQQFMIPAVLDFTQTQLIMRYAEFDENSRITQAPTLLTLSNQEATIFVGEQVPFVKQTGNTDANGNLAVTLSEGAGSPIAVGFTLFVTPNVIPNTDEIIMEVIPRVNTLTGTSSPIAGLERFASADGSNFIDLPRTQDQIVVTKLLVETGKTAVIGGLMQERLTEQEARIPILSSIPIIGDLFTFKHRDSLLDNLLIFITPTIVRTSEQATQLYETQHERLQQYDFFYGKYKAPPGTPWMHDLDGSEWYDWEDWSGPVEAE